MLHEYDEWDTPLMFHPLITALFHKMRARTPYAALRVGEVFDEYGTPSGGRLLHPLSAARENATFPPCATMRMSYRRRVRSADETNDGAHLVPTVAAALHGENAGGAVSVRQYLQRLVRMNEDANEGNHLFVLRGAEERWGGWAKEWVDEEGVLHLKGQMWSEYYPFQGESLVLSSVRAASHACLFVRSRLALLQGIQARLASLILAHQKAHVASSLRSALDSNTHRFSSPSSHVHHFIQLNTSLAPSA